MSEQLKTFEPTEAERDKANAFLTGLTDGERVIVMTMVQTDGLCDAIRHMADKVVPGKTELGDALVHMAENIGRTAVAALVDKHGVSEDRYDELVERSIGFAAAAKEAAHARFVTGVAEVSNG